MDRTKFQGLDRRITRWMANYGLTLLRVSVGIVFVWFGVLKFWPDLSPADRLATATIDRLPFGLIAEDLARVLLAILETFIGIGLVTGKLMRFTLLLLIGQMLGAATPLFLFPELTWSAPFVPTPKANTYSRTWYWCRPPSPFAPPSGAANSSTTPSPPRPPRSDHGTEDVPIGSSRNGLVN